MPAKFAVSVTIFPCKKKKYRKILAGAPSCIEGNPNFSTSHCKIFDSTIPGVILMYL